MGKTAKDKRDIYYRKAKEEGWRARSAFKLLQINEEFNIFKDVKKAVDLCAAPGSWSQVLSRELCEKNPNKDDVQIIAIDLQPMSPIPFVEQLQGDITEENTAKDVIKKFNNKKADLVICDGAPDVTGLHSMDEYMQSQLILAAFNITTFILKEGGNFIAKIFRARNCTLLYHQMQFFFKEVKCAKPKASRQSSCEAFIVCLGYNPPIGYLPTMKNSTLAMKYDDVVNTLNGPNRTLVPFVACGDLSGFDSDRSYPLDISKCFPGGKAPENVQEYKRLEVVQPPTEPAYKKALEHKKNDTLKKKMFLQSKVQKGFTKKKNPEETACNLGYEDEIVEAMSNIFVESNS